MAFPRINTISPPIGPKNCINNVTNRASITPVIISKPKIQSGLLRNCPDNI